MQEYIKTKIEKLNFKQTTPIQEEVFRNFNKKLNLVCIAPTGTGKTHAYLLPILSQINWELNIIQAIILAPTNELVLQIFEMIIQIENRKDKIKIFFGGMNRTKTYLKLKKKQPSIIITTLSKLFEYAHILKKINIYKSSFLVLDEADMFFEKKSLSLIKILLSKWKPKILLSSATLDKKMEPFINKNFGKSLFINVNHKHKSNLNFHIFKSDKNNRLKDLINVIEKINPFLAFIFVSHKKDQSNVYDFLKKKKLNILNFSSNLSVKERKRKIIEIKKNRYQYIITSDLASRGLDIKNISVIIHYDLPIKNLDFFKHRNGRAGRTGEKSDIILFYNDEEKKYLIKIKKKNNINVSSIIPKIIKNKKNLIKKKYKKKFI
ncbi:DEAD/DEAH box helicase [Candidatus Phytoplasma oryzae]|nr:DEAD/DEAH box helicase [Candidatus Phytoplasma oryzae]